MNRAFRLTAMRTQALGPQRRASAGHVMQLVPAKGLTQSERREGDPCWAVWEVQFKEVLEFCRDLFTTHRWHRTAGGQQCYV